MAFESPHFEAEKGVIAVTRFRNYLFRGAQICLSSAAASHVSAIMDVADKRPCHHRQDCPLITDKYSGLRHHAKVHSFRIGTALLAWILIGAAFYYRPDLIKAALRYGNRAIESVGDALPYPWGDRIEIMLREIGGFIWIQITALIILIRVVFSALGGLWRSGAGRGHDPRN